MHTFHLASFSNLVDPYNFACAQAKTPLEDTARTLYVKRSGVALTNGDEYVSGETLTIELSSTAGQGLIQATVDGLGRCTVAANGFSRTSGNTLSTQTITAPTDNSPLVVTSAWAASSSEAVSRAIEDFCS